VVLHLEKVGSVVVVVKDKRLEQERRFILSSKVDRLLSTCVSQNFVVVHSLQKLLSQFSNSVTCKRSLMQDVKEITIETLIENGYVRGQKPRVKLLSGGELTTPVTLSVHAASETAKKVLEKAGGTLNLVA
jgi:hypothetical protein